jgi:hypothetical protein
MYLEAHAMTRAVGEVIGETSSFQAAAGCFVNISSSNPKPRGRNCLLLRFHNSFVEVSHPQPRPAEVESSGHVGCVAREYSTKVEDNQLTGAQWLA